MKARLKYKKSIPLDNSRNTYDFRVHKNKIFAVQKRKTPLWKKEDALYRSKDLTEANYLMDNINLNEIVAKNQLKDKITKVLCTLTPREERIIRMRFGIGMNTDYTLEEVGLQFSLTRERVRTIEAKALRKLKDPSRTKELKDYLNEV